MEALSREYPRRRPAKIAVVIKSLIGAALGALVFTCLFGVLALVFGWFDFEGALAFTGFGAVLGAVLGWTRPMPFINTLLFWLEGDIFD